MHLFSGFRKPPVVPIRQRVSFICGECNLPKIGVPGQVVCSSEACRRAHRAKLWKANMQRKRHAAGASA